MRDSQELLAQYAANGSEEAFRELVERYVNLVHSTAVRLVEGDTHRAQDVAQEVFLDLARLARGFSRKVMLGGWLHRHTCFVAAKTLRRERRRQRRERQATEMSTLQADEEARFEQLAPILDEAINQLSTSDRTAIVLRFYEGRDLRSVGRALATNEDAAQKRVSRALEKLRSLLLRRGVALSGAGLAAFLGAHAVTAAPAGLPGNISTAVFSSTAALGSGWVFNLLEIMAMNKIKLAAGAVVLAAATTLVLQQQAQARLRQQNEALRERLRQTEQTVQPPLPVEADATELQRQQKAQSELLRLRGEVGRLRRELQAAAGQSNDVAVADENASTNVITGFTPLQASARARLTSGQALAVGGWPGHQGERLLALAVPEIKAEAANQVTVAFTAMEIPERILAAVGLDGLRTESTWSGRSYVLSAERLDALNRAFDELFEQNIKKEDSNGANEAASRGERLMRLGSTSVTSTNGQPVSLNYVVAHYDDSWTGASYSDGKDGDKVRIRMGQHAELDLGPYSGPTFTATPVVLSGGNSVDLTVQATVFWRFGDTR